MKRRRSIIGWLRIALLALLGVMGLAAALLAYVATHAELLKPVVSRISERFLDRSLVIDGELALDLSLQPRLTATDIRLGNADWSTEPHMVRAGYAMVQIDIPALFEKRVHLLDLDVRQGELLLEDPPDGTPNWEMPGDRTEPGTQQDEPAGPWTFMLEGLSIEDSIVRVQIGELEPIELEIPALEETTDASDYLVLRGHGRLNGEPWWLQGRMGTFEQLLAAGHIELDVALAVDDLEFEADGEVDDLQTLSGWNLTVGLSGPDADLFGRILRMPEAFTGDVALRAVVQPASQGQSVALDGNISQFSVHIAGEIRDLLGLDGWQADVDIQGPDATIFGKALQLEGFPGGPFAISGAVRRFGGDLDFNDVRITVAETALTVNADFVDFPRRSGATARLRLTGQDLSRYAALLQLPGPLPREPFSVDAVLDATDGAILTTSVRAGSHSFDASGPIGEYPGFSETRLTVQAQGEQIAELSKVAGFRETVTGPYRGASLLIVHGGAFAAEQTLLEAGPLQLRGSLAVPDIRNPMAMTVDGRLEVSDLASAGELVNIDGLPAKPLSIGAEVSADGERWQLIRSAGRLADLTFEASGALGTLSSLEGIDLAVQLSGPDIEVLFNNALRDTSRVPFSIAGRVRGRVNAIDLERVQLLAEGGALQIHGRLSTAPGFAGTRITVDGSGPSLASVIPSLPHYQPPEQPWETHGVLSIPEADHIEAEAASLSVGTVDISVDGVADLIHREQTSLTVTAKGDSFRELGRISDITLPELPFSLHAELQGMPDAFNIERFEASWGSSDLLAQGSIDLTARPRIRLSGSSSLLKIDDIQRAILGDTDEPAAEEPTGSFFPDTPIPLQMLDRQDWDVNVDIGRFEGIRSTLRDVDLRFRVEQSTLYLDHVQYRDQSGFFKTTGTVGPAADSPGSALLSLEITGEDADLGLFTSVQPGPESAPRYNLNISISGAGTTVAELVGNLDGTVLVWSDGGRIDNSLLDSYAGDFMTNLLEALNPFTSSEPFTAVQCLVLNAAIDDGRVSLEPGFVMRTNRVNMFVLGDINLKTERLNLSLATQARRGIGISAATLTNPYFKVGGTLARPALQLDAQSAALAASVATATAGLSIVVRGVWSRVMGEQNPCPHFLSYERNDTEKAGSGGT